MRARIEAERAMISLELQIRDAMEAAKMTPADWAQFPPPGLVWVHDPRIKAAVAAAPAIGYAFGRDGLRHVRVPVQLWRAEFDHVE